MARRRDTKQLIAKTARTLYREGGERAASMRKIAACIGIQASAIYKHYRNKSHLLDEIALDEKQRLRNHVWSTLFCENAPRHFVRALKFAVKYTRTDAHLFQLLRDRRFEDGKAPWEMFEFVVKNLYTVKRDPDFVAKHARRVWQAIVGAASKHTYWEAQNENHQLARTLETVRWSMQDVWSQWRREYPRMPEIHPMTPRSP